jgi:hypothetical protein
MSTTIFSKYKNAIRNPGPELLDPQLLMERDGDLSIFYAPFDAINPDARVAIVGITPGKTQMRTALAMARQQLASGASDDCALRAAKQVGAFSGPMRTNLISLLDRVGLGSALGLSSCSDLFGSAQSKLQTTSVLPFPVFLRGEDYRGTPDPLRHSLLRDQIHRHFAGIIKTLRHAVLVPLGPVPTAVLLSLADQGAVQRERILDGLPHPSGANAERIKYFLGQKRREELSPKTDAGRLDAARQALEIRVRAIAA